MVISGLSSPGTFPVSRELDRHTARDPQDYMRVLWMLNPIAGGMDAGHRALSAVINSPSYRPPTQQAEARNARQSSSKLSDVPCPIRWHRRPVPCAHRAQTASPASETGPAGTHSMHEACVSEKSRAPNHLAKTQVALTLICNAPWSGPGCTWCTWRAPGRNPNWGPDWGNWGRTWGAGPGFLA